VNLLYGILKYKKKFLAISFTHKSTKHEFPIKRKDRENGKLKSAISDNEKMRCGEIQPWLPLLLLLSCMRDALGKAPPKADGPPIKESIVSTKL